MLQDKSLFYYGPIYHRVFDGKLEEARQMIVDIIPEGASVLDIGCGTGELCFELCQQKNCKVIGLDLSLKMIRFAEERNTYPDVTFVHGDATELSVYSDHAFDFAVMLVFIHELEEETQKRALGEALAYLLDTSPFGRWLRSKLVKGSEGVEVRETIRDSFSPRPPATP